MTAFAWGGATDIGRVRQGNEDAMLMTDGLFVVADGMGGHRGGEVASRIAIESVEQFFTDTTTDTLVEAVEKSNDALVERAGQEPELEGMGTTLCALALVKGADHGQDRDLIGVVNVGDSRLYLLKEGELEQITEDHSLVATLERQGRLTRAEAAVHPQRNVLTRALGIDGKVMVDSWEVLPFVGDRYLLCSDGLFNEVDDNRIEATLRKLSDPGEAAHELVRLANEAGGRDNITCVVVDIVDDTGRDPRIKPTGSRVAHAVHGPERVLAAAGAGAGEPTEPTEPDDSTKGGPKKGRKRKTKAASASGTARLSGDELDPEVTEARRRSGLTWRVMLFAVVFLAILGVAIGSIVYAGTGTYYVGFDGNQVAIFRGRAGGVLWIQPQLVERGDLKRDQVPAAYVSDLEKGKGQPSVDAARRYIANLEQLSGTTATSGAPRFSPAPSSGPSGPSSPSGPTQPSSSTVTSIDIPM